MSFYDTLPRPFFVLAPMDDVTDTVFRQMVASCAAPDLFFTEFVNVDGLMSVGRPQLLKKLRFVPTEGKVVLQIWGRDPDNFRAVAEQAADGTLARELGLPEGVNFAGIDINMGCPAKSEVQGGTCSALIKRENWERASAMIEAVKTGVNGKLSVSVKTRVGFSAVDMEWFDHLLSHDLDMLVVHGRTRKQMSKVPADWSLIGEVAERRDAMGKTTLIVGNGDVMSREQGEMLAKQHKLDGIMIGRGIFHDPYVFAPLRQGPSLTQRYWETVTPAERLALFRRHVELFAETWQHGERPIHTLNKFCKTYIQGFDGAVSLRGALMIASTTNEILELLDNYEKSNEFVDPNEGNGYDNAMSDTIRAIVFDSDGTLLDTRQLILQGYKTVLKHHNLEHLATDHYIRQRLGKPVPQTYEQIIAGHDVSVTVEQLAEEHDEVQNALVKLIEPYPHTEQILRTWRTNGVKLCLFTSGKHMMIERNFAAAKMPDVSGMFDAIITADDGLAHKPAPDAILELLRRVNVSPADAIVVGDHAFDMIAGARAKVGLKIGVLHGFGTSHELLTAGADFLANDLESLNHLMNFSTK